MRRRRRRESKAIERKKKRTGGSSNMYAEGRKKRGEGVGGERERKRNARVG